MMSYPVMSYHIISYHNVEFHAILYHITAYIIPSHITGLLCRATPYSEPAHRIRMAKAAQRSLGPAVRSFMVLVRCLLCRSFHKSGALYGSPYNKDHSILGPLILENSYRGTDTQEMCWKPRKAAHQTHEHDTDSHHACSRCFGPVRLERFLPWGQSLWGALLQTYYRCIVGRPHRTRSLLFHN